MKKLNNVKIIEVGLVTLTGALYFLFILTLDHSFDLDNMTIYALV